MGENDASSTQICRQQDITQLQLDNFNTVERRLKEAEVIAAEANIVSEQIGKDMAEEESREKVDLDLLSENIESHYKKYEGLIDAARFEVNKYRSKVD